MGARLDSLAAPFPGWGGAVAISAAGVNLNIWGAGVNLNGRSAAGAGQALRPFRL